MIFQPPLQVINERVGTIPVVTIGDSAGNLVQWGNAEHMAELVALVNSAAEQAREVERRLDPDVLHLAMEILAHEAEGTLAHEPSDGSLLDEYKARIGRAREFWYRRGADTVLEWMGKPPMDWEAFEKWSANQPKEPTP